MGFVAAEVSNGLGRHKFYLPPGGYKKYLKYDYLDWAQVFMTLALSKISICLFLLRLSNYRNLRLWLYGLIAFLITSHVPLLFLMIFQCSPVRKYWVSPLEGPGVCFSKATVETIIIVQGGELSNLLVGVALLHLNSVLKALNLSIHDVQDNVRHYPACCAVSRSAVFR